MRVSSRKYRDGSRGQPCTLRIPGCCDGGGETTVFAHIRDRHTGRSIKASDVSGADSCFGCHEKFDGRSGVPMDMEDWLFYALRGMQETLENRIARGIVVVPLDAERLSADRPVKARKPAAERAKIAQPAEPKWPKGRPIPSRPLVRKSERTDA